MNETAQWGAVLLITVVVWAIDHFRNYREDGEADIHKSSVVIAGAFAIQVLCWLAKGEPSAGVVLSVAFVAACYAIPRILRQIRAPQTPAGRGGAVASVLWAVAVQLWGFISDWEMHYTTSEYIALTISGAILAGIAVFGLAWIKRASVHN